MQKNTVSITFRCSQEMKNELEKVAEKDNRKLSSYIINILDKELKKEKRTD